MPLRTLSSSTLIMSEVNMAASIHANSTSIFEAILKKCCVENALASMMDRAKIITVEISTEVKRFFRNRSRLNSCMRLSRKFTSTRLTRSETTR